MQTSRPPLHLHYFPQNTGKQKFNKQRDFIDLFLFTCPLNPKGKADNPLIIDTFTDILRQYNKKHTSCRMVLTTSLLETCPTSISPIRTANFRLSFIDIRTTSSGCFMSLRGGLLKSAIVKMLFDLLLSTDTQTLFNVH